MEKTLLEKNLEIDKLKDSKKAKEMELDNSRNDINISIKQEELTIKKIELELQTMKKVRTNLHSGKQSCIRYGFKCYI